MKLKITNGEREKDVSLLQEVPVLPILTSSALADKRTRIWNVTGTLVELVDAEITILLLLDVVTGLTIWTVLSQVDGIKSGRRLVVLPDLKVCVGKLIELSRLDTPLVETRSSVDVSSPSVISMSSPSPLSIGTNGTSVIQEIPRSPFPMVVTSTVPTTVVSVWESTSVPMSVIRRELVGPESVIAMVDTLVPIVLQLIE